MGSKFPAAVAFHGFLFGEPELMVESGGPPVSPLGKLPRFPLVLTSIHRSDFLTPVEEDGVASAVLPDTAIKPAVGILDCLGLFVGE